MQSRIAGTTMPVLEIALEPNESIISEAGELSWMTSSIQMTTHTQMGGGGGLFGALKRVAGGGTLFMTEYRAVGAAGGVAFATKLPGHIVPVEVGPGHEYMIHRHGFLCATPQIQLGVGFQQSLGAGIFGGDGFLLQRLSGQGTAWLELSGELIVKDLQPGELLRVHPGHVGRFSRAYRSRSRLFRGSRTSFSAETEYFLRRCRGRDGCGCRRCRFQSWRMLWCLTCRRHRSRRPRAAWWAGLWVRFCGGIRPGCCSSSGGGKADSSPFAPLRVGMTNQMRTAQGRNDKSNAHGSGSE